MLYPMIPRFDCFEHNFSVGFHNEANNSKVTLGNVAKRGVRFDSAEWCGSPIEHLAISRASIHTCTQKRCRIPPGRGGNEKESVEGESAVFVNFHVDGGCVSFACRCRVMMPAIFRQLSLCATLMGGCNGTVTVVELNSIISLASQPRYYPT